MDAGLHADDVADVVLQALVDLDQEVDGGARLARDRGDECGQQRTSRLGDEAGRELVAQLFRVSERKAVRIGLDEEIERIDDLDVGEEIDRD